MDRRKFVVSAVSVGTVGLAGCTGDGGDDGGVLGSSAEESGITFSDTTHRIDVEEGETIRVEVDNEEGFATDVFISGPDFEDTTDAFVETEETITHVAAHDGVYTIQIFPDGQASYEIYIE